MCIAVYRIVALFDFHPVLGQLLGTALQSEGGFPHWRYCRARDHSRAIGKDRCFHLQDGWQMVRDVRRTAWDKAAVWDLQLVSCESLDHQTSHRSLDLLMMWQKLSNLQFLSILLCSFNGHIVQNPRMAMRKRAAAWLNWWRFKCKDLSGLCHMLGSSLGW